VEQNKNSHTGIAILLRYAAVLFSLIFIGIYIFVALSRIGYPFELEWMEGASVIHVTRILEGRSLYVRPSLEFTPFFYPPLYFYISAFFALILGPGFLPLRIVSFLSSLGSLGVIYFWVKEETQDKTSGIIAAGFFAATFKLSGFWYDIARVDSLFLFLSLGGACLIKVRSSPKSFILAGALFSLAFLTKQTAIVLVAPLALYILIYKRKLLVYFLIPILLGMGGPTLLLYIATKRWYYYYLFYLPKNHEIIKENYIAFWTRDLFSPLFISLGISILFLIKESPGKSREKGIYYILLFMGFLIGSWMSRLHVGGWLNVLMPAYAAVSIVFGVGIGALGQNPDKDASFMRKNIPFLLYILCLLQYSILSYNPILQIPTQEDRKSGEYLIQTMKNIHGEIFVPYHSYLAEMAGKKSYMHVHSLFDISRGDRSNIGEEFQDELISAIRNQKFKAVFLDAPRITTRFEEYYTMEGILFNNSHVFFPVTGMKTRPEFLFVPKAK
jgi:4-amino-4-deoxy-L-arabinose transferase-like glycosyltransferase